MKLMETVMMAPEPGGRRRTVERRSSRADAVLMDTQSLARRLAGEVGTLVTGVDAVLAAEMRVDASLAEGLRLLATIRMGDDRRLSPADAAALARGTQRVRDAAALGWGGTEPMRLRAAVMPLMESARAIEAEAMALVGGPATPVAAGAARASQGKQVRP